MEILNDVVVIFVLMASYNYDILSNYNLKEISGSIVELALKFL